MNKLELKVLAEKLVEWINEDKDCIIAEFYNSSTEDFTRYIEDGLTICYKKMRIDKRIFNANT